MRFNEEILGDTFVFETDNSLFSPKHIDTGTKMLLEEVNLKYNDKVLDLGCGYGAVGIVCSKKVNLNNIYMCDISPVAVECAKKNVELNNILGIHILLSDGLNSIYENDFSVIISNPPYHTDFSVAKHFIEGSFKKLKIGGKLYMVTKRRTWYKNKLISIFGGVTIIEKEDYHIFCAEKRTDNFAKKKRKITTKKH